MRLYYFRAPDGNFGDDLNAVLWPELLGGDFFDDDPDEILVGIGTLLNHRVPHARRTIVFGSGYGYGTKPAVDDSWQFICVRGPRTAAELGLPRQTAIADPAILIAKYLHAAASSENGVVGFLPHCDSAAFDDWSEVARCAGLRYIDPRWPVDRVIHEIGRCQWLITEAMHGAIFADAMRIPWLPVVAYPHISVFKWRDWCESMELRYQPNCLPSIWRGLRGRPLPVQAKSLVKHALKGIGVWNCQWGEPLPMRSATTTRNIVVELLGAIVHHCEPFLSDDTVFSRRIEQLEERLDVLKRLK